MITLRSLFLCLLIITFSRVNGKLPVSYPQTTIEEQEDYFFALDSLESPIQAELNCAEAEENELEFTDDELRHHWDRAEEELFYIRQSLTLFKKKIDNQDFEDNEVIPQKIKNKLRPFIILDSHPKKAALDSIFGKSRVTVNEPSFLEAGFQIISKRPRSYVYVASHPFLEEYIVKAYMDTEMRLKQYKESWDWLAQRCIGAKRIKEIIRSKKIKNFTVASKWIYPLPSNHLPPSDGNHKLHFAILLAEDMNLVSKRENLRKWSTIITEKHLDELYYILTRAKGSSYRPDNIWYTKDHTFAFIDTEYPSFGPDYYSIRKYLSPEMSIYWDRIVKNGLR